MSERQRVELPSHEALARLAQEDPQAYEAWRREVIDRLIESAPARIRHRLRGIQFRVESMRRLSRSALGSTVKMYELMWKSFLSLNHNWQDLVHSRAGYVNPNDSTFGAQYTRNACATVLEFRPRLPRDQK